MPARSPAVYTRSLSPSLGDNDLTYSVSAHVITISSLDALAVSVPGIFQDSDPTRTVQEQHCATADLLSTTNDACALLLKSRITDLTKGNLLLPIILVFPC